MEILHTDKNTWRKSALERPEVLYSKKNNKRIRSTLAKLDEFHITYEFNPLTEEFLEWFSPLYNNLIGKKKNAVLHDLYAKTLNDPNNKYEHWSLTVLQGNTSVGGAIIFTDETKLMFAYRAFNPKWPEGTLQASPSLLAEFIASTKAYQLNKKQVSHGKDRNLYGQNSDIGQLVYKLSVGYSPRLPIQKNDEALVIHKLDTSSITQDTVVLHYPKTGELITEATLITSRENEDNYNQLLHYPNLLKVDVVFRN